MKRPIRIEKVRADGRTEVFEPYRYADGAYRVQVRVKDLAEVERLAEQGNEVRLMGSVSGKANLMKVEG